MKILFDICHPAHVHFFKHPIEQLKNMGHEILVTSRAKECTESLLDALGLEHIPLYTRSSSSMAALGKELIIRNKALYQVVKSWRPDVMAGIGGIFIAQVSKLTRVPAIVFYDGDNALMQNLLTYPFASKVVVPLCYQGWTPAHTARYAGFHELSYMRPGYFEPNYGLAISAGLKPHTANFLVRIVAWQASHDIGHQGFNPDSLHKTVERLASMGHVIISCETDLPSELEGFRYQGRAEHLHHLMAYCRGFIGESPTMAIEAAICGVPGLFVSSLTCGNIRAMEDYGLVRQVNLKQGQSLTQALDWLIHLESSQIIQRRQQMLDSTVDVSALIVRTLVGQQAQAAQA